MSLKTRPVEENDAETCGKIGYEAHKSISSSHGYPSEQPSKEYAIGLIKTILSNPNSLGSFSSDKVRYWVVYSFINFHHRR